MIILEILMTMSCDCNLELPHGDVSFYAKVQELIILEILNDHVQVCLLDFTKDWTYFKTIHPAKTIELPTLLLLSYIFMQESRDTSNEVFYNKPLQEKPRLGTYPC